MARECVTGCITADQRKDVLADCKGAEAGGPCWQKGRFGYELVGFYTCHRHQPKGCTTDFTEFRYLDLATSKRSELTNAGGIVSSPVLFSSDFQLLQLLLSQGKKAECCQISYYPDAYVGKAILNIGGCRGYRISSMAITCGKSYYAFEWVSTEGDWDRASPLLSQD